jgi:hypothetical protein
MFIDVRIHLGRKEEIPDDKLMSQILSALYGRMGDNGWTSVMVEHPIPEEAK